MCRIKLSLSGLLNFTVKNGLFKLLYFQTINKPVIFGCMCLIFSGLQGYCDELPTVQGWAGGEV